MVNNIITSNVSTNFWLMIVLPVAITSPFLFIACLAAAGIAESETREVWPDKLLTFDVLRRGSVLVPDISLSIVRGFVLAFLSAGTLTLLLKIFNQNFDFYMIIKNEQLLKKISFSPLLLVIFTGIMNAFFGETTFRLFVVSFFRKKMSGKNVIILISLLLWIFTFGNYANLKLSSYLIMLIINLVIGLYFILFFFKWDYLAVLWGAFSYYLLKELFPFIYYNHSMLVWNGIAVWIIFGFVLIIALIGLTKKREICALQEYVPDYVKRHEERDRMLRELEIARSVQLSFLPRHKPSVPGIDVASICIPATEVGGDYYDFLELDNHRLGVVIGDVSGKGISAAFHMTLTKGFIKSQAKLSLTPREVMIHLNELFYENVERGTFISMIYGIIDLKSKTFTFARAGHNPVMVKKSQSLGMDILCPRGLALGLEKGEIFNRVIEEHTIGIQSKDVFMFYTDGFSEAMNKKKEEFGEENLYDIVNKFHTISAENITAEVKAQIFDFIGSAQQHDDMTMIIIKIL